MTNNINLALEALREIAERSFYDDCSIQFMTKLRFQLVDRGFGSKFAEDVSTRIVVKISDGSTTSQELDQLAQSFCDIIEKMFKAFKLRGFEDPHSAVVNCAPSFNISL